MCDLALYVYHTLAADPPMRSLHAFGGLTLPGLRLCLALGDSLYIRAHEEENGGMVCVGRYYEISRFCISVLDVEIGEKNICLRIARVAREAIDQGVVGELAPLRGAGPPPCTGAGYPVGLLSSPFHPSVGSVSPIVPGFHP